MSDRTVAVVQARLGSTRLPRKVLADLGGKPVLAWVIARLRRATSLDDVVIATTTLPEDQELVDWCDRNGVFVTAGDPEDLLDRYLQAGRQFEADVLVRVTSDCPLVDPTVVDRVVHEFFEASGIDYCSNTLDPRSYPRGLDVEVFTFAALQRASLEDLSPTTREHVTPHIRVAAGYSRRPVGLDVDLSNVRWTVDTDEDLGAIRCLVDHFEGQDTFTWAEALVAWRSNPEWAQMNMHVKQKPVLGSETLGLG